ncbi:hypothetical protein BOTNAR_0048g00240 [Botryotinia narcissicola]|uniref:Uncharacterized protein n=1 Tax=Botryotinia narcissicola TaxID=278944 RepID=A0A4Z1JDT5_9HELO|nr:hypothetical protein BOTNAR_0048g00240 [Botryotinia narcissicola]
MSGGTMMTGPANLFPWLRNDTVAELHKKMAFLTFEKLVDSGDGPTLETDQLRIIVEANKIKTSCWLGHLTVEEIVDLLKGVIQEGWYEKKVEVLKDLQPDWFVPATLKDTGKTEEVVNAIEKNEDEASLLHGFFGLTEKKNSKDEPTLNLYRTCRESKPISERNSTALAAIRDPEYEEGQVDTGEATKNPGKNDKRSTSSQELVAQNKDLARLSRNQKLPHGPDNQRERGRATRPDQSRKRRRNTPSPERANQRRRTNNLGESYEAHNRFGINTGGDYGKLLCALLWYKAGHAELQESHKCLGVQGYALHCAVHHKVDAPVLIIKGMVYDCIELTIMLRDPKATELMETIWEDTVEEIFYNSNNSNHHEDLIDELRRTNKKIDKLTATHHALNRKKEDIYWEFNGRHSQ